MGSNYDPILAKKLIPIQWVILERIGRSRFHGVTTTGQESLQNFAKINAKDLFYHRKVMLRHGLVTKQNIGNYDLKSTDNICRKNIMIYVKFTTYRKQSNRY